MNLSASRTVLGLYVAAIACTYTAPACRAQANTEAEARKIAPYPLTIDLFNRYAAVTLELARMPKDSPAVVEMKGLQDLPLDGKIQRVAASPTVMAVLKTHGISARDMIMTSAAITAVMIVKAAMQTGAGKNEYNKLDWEASVPDHIKFLDAHKAELQKFQDDLMKAIKQH